MNTRTLNDREQRLVRLASAGLLIYLALFFIARPLQKRRSEYQNLVLDAQVLKERIRPYPDRALAAKKLMEEFQLDPAKLSRASVVGEASAAIQRAAAGSGLQVGSVRESPARSSSKELASVTFEGTGPVPAVLGLLKRMETLGYPMIIDSVQIAPETRGGPGQVKLNLTIVILDFEQWKAEEKPNA
jgi:hypothetical protein